MKKEKTRQKSGNKKPKQNQLVIEHSRSSQNEFTNREIGWLHFNRRVLTEAEDERNPLLERLRFLAISQSNLDEFIMKRVGGLKRQTALGVMSKSSDGQTPRHQLELIREFVMQMQKDQAKCFLTQIKPAMQKENIRVMKWQELNARETEWVKNYYTKNVFPVLTPLSVDPGHPFPFISNLSVSLGITLKHPEKEEKQFARLKVPKVLPQMIRIPLEDGNQIKFIHLVDVIRENLQDLFPVMHILNVMPFRLTRNADTERGEEAAEDLLEHIEEELRQRRFAEVVRLEYVENPDPWILQFLVDELEISEDDVYTLQSELDFTDFNLIYDLPLKHLKFETYIPVVPQVFADETVNIFQALKSQDYLLHHPYESFGATVEKFIRTAADDPKVLAIKMTLYRTGDQSPFIRSLIRAAEQGKQVVCLIELKARFDEERNIYWAQALENAGVHVVYGVVGLKTHAKTSLVVRQEPEGLRCYTHIGTGNYNVATSKFYTDLGLLTAKDQITKEVVDFFNFLTGISRKSAYQSMLIAPVNMFSRFRMMIDREGEFAKQGKPSQIIAKCNNLEENDLVISLYQASQKGTEVDLIVRGFCCLRPGVPGLSDRIRVISVIGRFLEHSRIFYFRNGAADPIDGEFYIGSADWMYRNLHARVEAIVPILERHLREKCWEILQMSLKDQRQVWQMQSDGSYIQRKSQDAGVHLKLMIMAQQRTKFIEEQNADNDGQNE
ncbi:MAG: polyphosphate kinase 1 [Pseudobdellovibrionaceae bacterium]